MNNLQKKRSSVKKHEYQKSDTGEHKKSDTGEHQQDDTGTVVVIAEQSLNKLQIKSGGQDLEAYNGTEFERSGQRRGFISKDFGKKGVKAKKKVAKDLSASPGEDIFDCHILVDHPQHLALKLTLRGNQDEMVVSLVYAKCSQEERMELWPSLEDIATTMVVPWLISGDFNVITSDEEKYGGLPVTINEVQDFRDCVQSCGVADLGFKGSKFTCWNGQSGDDYIFKRLDICLGNHALQMKFTAIEISHFIRTGSDHVPLLISYFGESVSVKKPFKFLNFWAKHDSFLDIVRALVQWSKQTFGNIFQEIETLEEVIKEFWKQKAGMQWFQDGDRNTRFFHAYVQGRRRRLQLKRIHDADGNWIEDADAITVEAIGFYQKQFTKEEDPTYFDMLDQVPRLVSEEQNWGIEHMPTKEEVRNVVFQLNGESAAGPDGLQGCFFSLSIVENVLLTQEIIYDIRLRTRNAKVVMKLDMAKAYDRVSWLFLTKVLRKRGFSERLIDMGDPLSPTLFILSAEVLSKNLNNLHHVPQFKGFGMHKWSPMVNHLASADDMIIFSSANMMSLQLIMEILRKHEKTSGQKINKEKSSVYMHKNVAGDVSITVEIATGITRKDFPFIYLGCPIYHSRRKKEFFNAILLKIMNRL
ncbi:uncharacterized protein LOC132035027 [Lycium ferocissimum]|uniref:uncharacterized protein LOC132035027 n=1 Tax=Lycium ferocissimum TaxID=112874 RepID=UPI0028157111|nr:uncharacterized protein LOC132035027 [Lycium ferocissimum]